VNECIVQHIDSALRENIFSIAQWFGAVGILFLNFSAEQASHLRPERPDDSIRGKLPLRAQPLRIR
jgi:hypothetical protein